ncbi:hypothetical protein AB3S75_042232 [Citrus x aurantiifolia]
MASCFQQGVGLIDVVLADGQDIPAPAHRPPESCRIHLFAEPCYQMSAHHCWSPSKHTLQTPVPQFLVLGGVVSRQ